MMIAQTVERKQSIIPECEWEFSIASAAEATSRFISIYGHVQPQIATIYMVRGYDNTVFPVYVAFVNEKPKLPWVLKEVQQSIRPAALASRSQIIQYQTSQG